MPHTEKIKFVLLDIDDTLLDFDWAEKNAIRKTLEHFGFPSDAETLALYSKINSEQWSRLERNEIERKELLTIRFDILMERLGIVGVSSAVVHKKYESLLGLGHKFMDGAEELLEALYGSYKLYIVSNGTGCVQDGRLQSAGIGKYFEDIFISERIGYDKPDRRFFETCFERIEGFRSERAIIVGDRLGSDILGGINAGIKTCWFNPKGAEPDPQIPADYEIKALSGLPGLLETL